MADQAALDEFNAWWEPYKARFDGDYNENLYPTINDNQFVSGYMVKQFGSTNEAPGYSDLSTRRATMREWVWIVGHCVGSVKSTDSHWLFEDHKDAILFKLQHRDN